MLRSWQRSWLLSTGCACRRVEAAHREPKHALSSWHQRTACKRWKKVELFLQTFLAQLQIIGIGIAQKFAEADDFLVKPLCSILPAQHFAVRAVA
jgi:hypothetical protein